MKISVPRAYYPLDAPALSRAWVADSVAAWRRKGNDSVAMRVVASLLDTALAMNPRTIASIIQTPETTNTVGLNPWGMWMYYDGVANARDYTVHIVYVPNPYAVNYVGAYGAAWNEPAYSSSATNLALWNNEFTQVAETEYTVHRGSRTLSDVLAGVSTFEGFTVLAVTAQDKPFTQLDTDLHLYANAELAKPGNKITEKLTEQIRSAMHDLRLYNLPLVVQWSGLGNTASVGAPGDNQVITVTSETFVNVLDQSVTARDANSPGFSVDRYAAGVGRQTSIECSARVYAECSGATGYVRFIGPDHVGANEVTITVPDGAGLAVYGDVTSIYYLNPAAAADNTTTACNKTDVHARVDAGGTLRLRAFAAQETASPLEWGAG